MDNLPLTIFLWFSTPLVIIALYFKYSYQHWENKKVPTPKTSMPFGSIENPFVSKTHLFRQITNFYQEFKATGAKHLGYYTFAKPIYVPIDLELVKSILGKDFAHFSERGQYYNEVDEPLSAHLFSLDSSKWRPLRAKLTPTFTSGKMKSMFPILVEVGKQLEDEVFKIHAKKQPLDIKEILGRYSTDIIGSCAFGIDCNSFENPDSDFRKYGKMVINRGFWRFLKRTLSGSYPNLFRKSHMKVISDDVHDFFMNLAKTIIKQREEGHTRKDFVQIMVDLKNTPGSNISINEIAAQMFIFFLAGFETSSSAMTFCLHNLATNLGIQEKVRKEVREVLARHKGEITYESLKEMKYLEQVVDETSRLYPALGAIPRMCTKNYTIPDTDIVIEKGTRIFIPVLAIHYDPEYYPDPEKFDPERFSEENKSERHTFAHLPFGEGPRNCIGLRFGMMQTKLGLALMLKNFKFTLNKKTQLPLTMNPFMFITAPNETIWLDVEKV